jgi:hypothetical protein
MLLDEDGSFPLTAALMVTADPALHKHSGIPRSQAKSTAPQ